jgi:hypothetical protein
MSIYDLAAEPFGDQAIYNETRCMLIHFEFLAALVLPLGLATSGFGFAGCGGFFGGRCSVVYTSGSLPNRLTISLIESSSPMPSHYTGYWLISGSK